ncbi:Mpp10 protein-domain-containing protein [Cladochytrium replicatum]|nr:Mpp10 protein-domain-containing protein [Cladochytrium replicatum]
MRVAAEDPPNPSLIEDSLEHPSSLISSAQTALFLKLTSHFHSHLTSSVLKDNVLFSIPKRRPNIKTGPTARANLELDGVFDGEAVWGVVGGIAEAVGTLVSRASDAFVARGDLKAGFEDEKAEEDGDEERDDDGMDVDEDLEDEDDDEEDLVEVDEDMYLDDEDLDLDGDEGDDDEDLDLDGDEGDDDLDLDGDDDLDLDEDDLGRSDAPRTRKEPSQTSIVDDEFFSLEEFNRFSDRAERYDMMQAKTDDIAQDNADDDFDEKDLDRDLGAPKGLYESEDEAEMDEDEEEEDDDEDNANDLRYEDFYAPPDERRRRNRDNRNHSFDDSESNPTRRVTFDTNEDVREYTPSAPPDALSSQMRDLFSTNSADSSSNDPNLSNFERQQRATASAIAELEAEAVAEKPWLLRGESSAPNRPRDSLLEVHLDTDVASKPVPVITPTHTASLEELIISRIKGNLFDSVERRKPPMDVAYDPDRRIQLDDQKSSKGLAEVYEDAYLAQNSTAQTPGPKSADLEKSHEEIRAIWKEICGPLDALASTHARPRGARVEELEVATVPADTPALENEDVHPTAMSLVAAVAPSEVYSAKTTKSSEEMGANEKRKARKKSKHAAGRAKKEKEEDMKAKEAWKKGIAPERKENRKEVKRGKREALRGLMKTKGVTVVAEGSMKGEVERASGGGKKGKNGVKKGGAEGGARVVKAGETIGGNAKAAVRAEFLRL